MIPDSLRKWQVTGSGSLGPFPIAGAAPQQANGSALQVGNCSEGTLMARVVFAITTTALALTAKWQVQNKAGTWIDVLPEPHNPAPVVLNTGTGSLVTKELVIPAPRGVASSGFRNARLVLVSSGATGAGGAADVVNSIDYSYTDSYIAF